MKRRGGEGKKEHLQQKTEYFKDTPVVADGWARWRFTPFQCAVERAAGSFVPFFLFVDTQAPKYKPEIPEHKACESTFLSKAHNSVRN
jgi:hypothetical protein